MQKKLQQFKITSYGLGQLINNAQTTFVGMLRLWSIPIVLLLSLASGFTTYYGMAHFITPWIALVITVAIQSIIVICSLEIAGIHWKANRFRYFSIFLSLVIAVCASVSFSYFKFYEISERDTIRINRMNQVRADIHDFLDETLKLKGDILTEQREKLEKTSKEVSLAYFGTHPEIVPQYKNQVGEGPFWKRFNDIFLEKKAKYTRLEQEFLLLDGKIRQLQAHLSQLDISANDIETAYQEVQFSLQDVQLKFNQVTSSFGKPVPVAPVLMSYLQFSQGVKPSFSMWQGFSFFAFACAAMVDFFTVLLSYRLEFTAPGPLTTQEEELVLNASGNLPISKSITMMNWK